MSAPFARSSGWARNLAAIVAGALIVRLALMVERGDYIVYDEGYYLLLARSLRAGHGFALNGLPHVSLSPLQPLLVAALSTAGLSDLWASRLLAVVAGSLLVLPVAYLARTWFGERAAVIAATFVAVSPGVLTFLPFFPGQSWNLYFGSEPLYLLLATCAMAAGWRAVTERSGLWLAGTGALAALAYLTRLEGTVLGAGIAVAVLALSIVRKQLAASLPGMLAGALVALMIVTPYLIFLHRTLGRWAVSGRVQAAAVADQTDALPVPAAPSGGAPRRASAVNAFIWGGDREALWRALNALDATGEHMASQYWGVPPRSPRDSLTPPARVAAHGVAAGAPDSTASSPAPNRSTESVEPQHGFSTWYVLARALTAVTPWWFLLLALPALAWARPRWEAIAWLGPPVLSVILPSVLAYVEPRVLLVLVPVACILAGATAERLGDYLARRVGRAWISVAVPAAVAVALMIPTCRDAAGAWNQDTPLQRVAAARRAAGEYLGAHLAKDDRIVSWHPAIALYARRDWRVLPYDSFVRIIRYARAQGAAIVVFSRFEPSPLRNPPSPFTAVLTVGAVIPGEQIRLDLVDQTPVLFVGRLAGAAR